MRECVNESWATHLSDVVCKQEGVQTFDIFCNISNICDTTIGGGNVWSDKTIYAGSIMVRELLINDEDNLCPAIYIEAFSKSHGLNKGILEKYTMQYHPVKEFIKTELNNNDRGGRVFWYVERGVAEAMDYAPHADTYGLGAVVQIMRHSMDSFKLVRDDNRICFMGYSHSEETLIG